MTPEQAVDVLLDKALDLCESAEWEWTVTHAEVEAVVACVLGDVPLLMQAIGGEREVVHSWYNDDVEDRWVTPWREATGG